MSGDLTPTKPPMDTALEPAGPSPVPKVGWGAPREDEGVQWSRYTSALKRYKWMILLIVLAGTGLGFSAARMIDPVYTANATVVLSQPNSPASPRGPIQAAEVFSGVSWLDLLKTSAILDNAVKRAHSYLYPALPADSVVFQDFDVADRFEHGDYRLTVSPDGRRWSLLTAQGRPVDAGIAGDSIGRKIGFRWAPSPQVLRRGRNIDFGVAPIRDISQSVLRRLYIRRSSDQSDFLLLQLTGTNPNETARTLNAVIAEFVYTAGELKKRSLREVARTLERQLDTAALSLREAENKYQGFRANTITLPSDVLAVRGTDLAPSSPVMDQFFRQRMDLDNISRDRRALETVLRQARSGKIGVDAFLAIQSVANAQELQTALDELNRQEAALRAAQVQYTDSFPTVKNLRKSIEQLRSRAIPTIATGLLEQLSRREQDLTGRVRTAEREIRAIPARSIEEQRLQRDVKVKENVYTMLKDRYEQTKLSEASAQPDVGIVDTAAVPRWPSSNSAPRIILIALMASIGGGLGLALLLDHTDRRFRYPQQATNQLGLTVVGAVPRIRSNLKSTQAEHEQQSHMVEAFRSIRLNVRSQYNGRGPVALTISSPGPGDGKSLVSLNLALSFAEAGSRTVLLDGDIRRGQLHSTFNVSRVPGLIDYLSGEVTLAEITHGGIHEKLSLIPCGTRRQRGPELLTSPALLELMAQLRPQYDVIIVDSPPFGAGIDAYALSAATQNLLVVLRAGETDLRVAESKLELVDRLPIRVLGAVLNNISTTEGAYKTYSYLYGYALEEDDERPQLIGRVSE
ncbi:MAG TPA: polysaccharide biosynthesis tyrosine autokinase [Gemmatimonadaceae bacterium]|nr:polysaccharide biosynthesis tyrosine autokinase [Gemmatimonadaceae bacterium]